MLCQHAVYADGVTKRYGNTVGCEEVSLSVLPGHVFGLLGPNGAGKSTLVKVLAGLHAPTAGRALIFGHPAGTLAASRLIGYVPELFGVPAWPTARQLLRFYGQISDVPMGELNRRIDEALERVGLPLAETADRRVGGFSKGMRQRLTIAAALVHRPKLLVLDEPTSALDPIGRREVRDLMLDLKAEGVTIFLNSHLLDDVERVADWVAIIRAGRVILEGAPDELMGNPRRVLVRTFPVAPAVAAALQPLGQVSQEGGAFLLDLAHPEDLGQVASAVQAAGARLLELAPQRPSLEDLFVSAVEEVGGDA